MSDLMSDLVLDLVSDLVLDQILFFFKFFKFFKILCDRICIHLYVCSGALPSNYLCDLYARPGTPMYIQAPLLSIKQHAISL